MRKFLYKILRGKKQQRPSSGANATEWSELLPLREVVRVGANVRQKFFLRHVGI